MARCLATRGFPYQMENGEKPLCQSKTMVIVHCLSDSDFAIIYPVEIPNYPNKL